MTRWRISSVVGFWHSSSVNNRSGRIIPQQLIDMQEVAQMVAWVKQDIGTPGNDTPGNDTRVLVSQDATDIYISVFRYDQG